MTEHEATLVSVNVGLPRDVEWQGRTVHTGIWKQAVEGPCRVRRLNLDGDGQGDLAGHGGEQRAVYVYQLDSYRHWAEQLGRDDFVFGQFGENFTVDGLADDRVCIGDRYRIGSALFEVTQPRVTCYRLGLRMDEPRMPALLVAHGRPGFYLRVIEEGTVQAGDEIVEVATGPEQMTVASVSSLLYLDHHDSDLLGRALRIPALSPGWHGSFRALLDEHERGAPGGGNAGLTATAPPPGWPGFRPLRVVAKRWESTSVVSLDLEADDGQPLVRALPGQFVAVRLRRGGGAAPLVRSYSLSGPPGDARYRISVKVEPHGAAGRHLRDAVEVGDRIDVAAPRGHFTLDDDEGRPVALVSAGVGVTPVLAMLHALSAEGAAREVWWLHGARNAAEHAFSQEAGTLIASLSRAHRRVWYSRPGPDDQVGVDHDEVGRLTAEALAATGVPTDSEFYLCGPAAFMDQLRAGLDALGVPSGLVHTEAFGAEAPITPGVVAQGVRPPHPPEGRTGTGPLVSFVRTGLNVPWDDARASILELAEACDVPVRWSCRTGVCHTCETGLLDGTVAYDPDPLEPPGAGNVLVCCARPGSDVSLDL